MKQKNQEIKNKINDLEWVLVGTLLKSHKQCGKDNCKCVTDKKYWHGPYYIWTRKENGKTVTKTLTKVQAQYVLNAFKNMKKLNRLLEKWKKMSIANIDKMK